MNNTVHKIIIKFIYIIAVLIIIFINNQITAQETHNILGSRWKNERAEPLDFQRKEWLDSSSLSYINVAVANEAPSDRYYLDQVESSDWENWPSPYYWFACWNPVQSSWMDEENPSVLQIYCPPYEHGEPELLKEISFPYFYIAEIGWVSVGESKMLYIITVSTGFSRILCYKLIEADPYIELVSEQGFHFDVCWMQDDIDALGSYFIFLDTSNRYEPPPLDSFDNTYIVFCPVSEEGVLAKYYIHLNDLLTDEEISTYIRSNKWAEETIQFLSVKFRTSNEWQDDINEYIT